MLLDKQWQESRGIRHEGFVGSPPLRSCIDLSFLLTIEME
jgi:hypothetical protein